MAQIINYVIKFQAPILTLVIGALLLIFVGYLHWYGDIKTKSIKWIARKIYRNSLNSEKFAEGLFMTATTYLLVIGGLIILVSILFLNPST